MQDNNSDIEKMRELIEKKKQKSASQGSIKRGPQDRFGTTHPKNLKKNKTNQESSEE
ncbi:MAG: hypothetical protein ACM3PE_10260 [Deltaproteobacteria bacterium]